MIFRRKRDRIEREGWWQVAAPGPSPELRGKIEWEWSGGGGMEIDLLVRKVDVPDGDEVEVVLDGRTILRAPVKGGSARKIIRSSEGHDVPDLDGRAVELHHRGTVLARTVLEPD